MKPPKLEIAKVYAMDSKIEKEQAKLQEVQWQENVERIKHKKFEEKAKSAVKPSVPVTKIIKQALKQKVNEA